MCHKESVLQRLAANATKWGLDQQVWFHISASLQSSIVGCLSGTGWKARIAALHTIQSCKQVCKTGQTEIKASRKCVMAVLAAT